MHAMTRTHLILPALLLPLLLSACGNKGPLRPAEPAIDPPAQPLPATDPTPRDGAPEPIDNAPMPESQPLPADTSDDDAQDDGDGDPQR